MKKLDIATKPFELFLGRTVTLPFLQLICANQLKALEMIILADFGACQDPFKSTTGDVFHGF